MTPGDKAYADACRKLMEIHHECSRQFLELMSEMIEADGKLDDDGLDVPTPETVVSEFLQSL